MKTTMTTLLLLFGLTTALSAQEAAPPLPDLPPVVMVEIDGKADPIRITGVKTEVRILGAIAETRTTLTLRNPHERAPGRRATTRANSRFSGPTSSRFSRCVPTCR